MPPPLSVPPRVHVAYLPLLFCLVTNALHHLDTQNNSQSMHLTLPPPNRSIVGISTTRGQEQEGSGNREESCDAWGEREVLVHG
jgi:hypothetical protein